MTAPGRPARAPREPGASAASRRPARRPAVPRGLQTWAAGRVLAAGLGLAGCAGPGAEAPTPAAAGAPLVAPADDRAFLTWQRHIEVQARADPYFKPIPVRSLGATQAYQAQLQAAWHGRVSRAAFVQWFEAQYPGQRYEAEFIAQRLPR